jgi:hypothetical protein
MQTDWFISVQQGVVDGYCLYGNIVSYKLHEITFSLTTISEFDHEIIVMNRDKWKSLPPSKTDDRVAVEMEPEVRPLHGGDAEITEGDGMQEFSSFSRRMPNLT